MSGGFRRDNMNARTARARAYVQPRHAASAPHGPSSERAFCFISTHCDETEPHLAPFQRGTNFHSHVKIKVCTYLELTPLTR